MEEHLAVIDRQRKLLDVVFLLDRSRRPPSPSCEKNGQGRSETEIDSELLAKLRSRWL